jgi:hypothetical protein
MAATGAAYSSTMITGRYKQLPVPERDIKKYRYIEICSIAWY